MVGTGEIDFLLTNVIKISLKVSAYITFLLLLLLMFGLKLIILNPLKKLTLAVRYFAQKDFSARSKVTSNDEIGYLSKTFNYMAESLETHNQRMIQQIYYDSLTGLPNRTKIIEDLKSIKDGILLLINIDSFKEINDFYGYEIGDEIHSKSPND